MTVLTQLLNGLQLGSVYALVALGYTMVYGIILLLNFAHGDIIMVGAYISWIALAQLGLHPVLAAVLAVAGCTLLGVLIDKVAYAPLRNAPRLSILITAIGVSYFLENGSQLIFGADAKVVPAFIDASTITLGGMSLSFTAILTIVVTALSTIAVTLLVQKTKLGKAMRAVSEDMGAARLMGINVNNTISFTFAMGSALAGIGSVLYSMAYTQATPTMGIMLGTKAFVAAVLGGIGSLPGAVIGGLLVGMAEVFVSAIGLSVWKDAVVFLLLIVVLIFRPTGILGRTMNEKV
ncbi:branched-chain amino acid transport system permease protein [Olsenella profusa DSM 13989]|uniref:Branched-chain amino acid ABC transporter, permease protein n=1 Tax=Olsenella profusa F0195 TaxID=1125712 RepID=U2UYW7_9ACTN|nr:branched-chain amino acid ABC transporter permease [Olsenella profusa]ERL08292.1 branched-chain amino acid ABC transporter, permease protein [Olsenella profusa F0195]MDP9860591.1 branched-chain amino acid transport system permease protein [Olsenella profusa DSM 13989]